MLYRERFHISFLSLSLLFSNQLLPGDPHKNADTLTRESNGNWKAELPNGNTTSVSTSTPQAPKGPEIIPNYGNNNTSPSSSSGFLGGILGFIYNLGKPSKSKIRERPKREVTFLQQIKEHGIDSVSRCNLSEWQEEIIAQKRLEIANGAYQDIGHIYDFKDIPAPKTPTVPQPVLSMPDEVPATAPTPPIEMPKSHAYVPGTDIQIGIGGTLKGRTGCSPATFDGTEVFGYPSYQVLAHSSVPATVPKLPTNIITAYNPKLPTFLPESPFKAGNFPSSGGGMSVGDVVQTAGGIAAGAGIASGALSTTTFVGTAGGATAGGAAAAGGTAAGGTVVVGGGTATAGGATVAGGTATTTTIGSVLVAAAPIAALMLGGAVVGAGLAMAHDYIFYPELMKNRQHVFPTNEERAMYCNPKAPALAKIPNPNPTYSNVPIENPNPSPQTPNPKKPDDDKKKERKTNNVQRTEAMEKLKENYRYDKSTKLYKLKDNGIPIKCTRTKKVVENVKWDGAHSDIEALNGKLKHMGSLDPETFEMYKGPVKNRTEL